MSTVKQPDLSVIVLASHAAAAAMNERLQRAIEELDVPAEVIVADGLGAARERSCAPFVAVVEPAVLPGPERIGDLWRARDVADIVVASRFSRDRATKSPELVDRVDRWTDQSISRMLSLDTLDVRSRTRLYRREVLDDLASANVDLDDAVGVLAAAASRGWRIFEQPLLHWPSSLRGHHRAHGVEPRPRLRQLRAAWGVRNTIDASDYDLRAFNSRLPPQRWWQQHRHAVMMRMVDRDRAGRFLNVGCGSGWLSLDLPGSIGVDVVHTKLRHMRRYRTNQFVNASIFHLPFPDATFGTVICAEVIEHVPAEPSPIDELLRVLHPDGRLVLTTPDYGSPVWPAIEKVYGRVLPFGYADEHITHYTHAGLIELLADKGWRCVGEDRAYRSISVTAYERA